MFCGRSLCDPITQVVPGLRSLSPGVELAAEI
jgi:hypothetical protein